MVHDGDPIGEAGDDVDVVLDHQHRLAVLARAPTGSARRAPARPRADARPSARRAGSRPCRPRAASRARACACPRAGASPRATAHARRDRPARAPTARARSPRGRRRAAPDPQRTAAAASTASRTFSSTVRSGKTLEIWNVRPSPAASACAAASSVMSRAVELDPTRVGRFEPREQVEERRLAGPVRADDPEELARGHLEPDIGDDGCAADVEPEVAGPEDRRVTPTDLRGTAWPAAQVARRERLHGHCAPLAVHLPARASTWNIGCSIAWSDCRIRCAPFGPRTASPRAR